ncbi:pyridoxamine 5'-phosphate oxidase [Umboniibacter marinipuniceus]|uniref:Pyridoxine/pyridoxamine 5'-phosphate oxidase n=1 Tax=Umboniibacter marinipuniceus TaxID=569599 RepID=A0A3M0AAJ3_9GAMM|nr:pyridoxamine 5'-phosphate oxidase [Umboniibacter marinipuniceus]RMA81234.1 pyridoxamine 5'-phosphate oxidase [Umboniibacter marinipuniceus]
MTDMSDIRREYQLGELHRNQLSSSPHEQFERWFQQSAESGLIKDPTAMTLSTVSPDGYPTGRIVLLKGHDQSGFRFFTNYTSDKAEDINFNANVSLLFAWLPLERQVLISGSATQLSREENEAYFHSRPRASQIAAWSSFQSAMAQDRSELDARFEALSREFEGKEVPCPEFWGGYRVEAHTLEFWQGRSERLHDRFRYTRTENGWHLARYNP